MGFKFKIFSPLMTSLVLAISSAAGKGLRIFNYIRKMGASLLELEKELLVGVMLPKKLGFCTRKIGGKHGFRSSCFPVIKISTLLKRFKLPKFPSRERKEQKVLKPHQTGGLRPHETKTRSREPFLLFIHLIIIHL